MSNKMKKILSVFIPLLLLAATFTTSQPVHAQTQSEATECFRKYNGKGAVDGTFPGTPLVGLDRFNDSGCKYASGQGNCLYKEVGGDDDDALYQIYCTPSANTEPRDLDAGINDLDRCVDQSELSFDWGSSCVDSAGLISFVFGVLASIVGIAVVGGIAWGGMMYATSNGNSAKAQQGIMIIVNAVIGLLLFIFIFAVTNFLVPGGVFRS